MRECAECIVHAQHRLKDQVESSALGVCLRNRLHPLLAVLPDPHASVFTLSFGFVVCCIFILSRWQPSHLWSDRVRCLPSFLSHFKVLCHLDSARTPACVSEAALRFISFPWLVGLECVFYI